MAQGEKFARGFSCLLYKTKVGNPQIAAALSQIGHGARITEQGVLLPRAQPGARGRLAEVHRLHLPQAHVRLTHQSPVTQLYWV